MPATKSPETRQTTEPPPKPKGLLRRMAYPIYLLVILGLMYLVLRPYLLGMNTSAAAATLGEILGFLIPVAILLYLMNLILFPILNRNRRR